MSGEYSVVVRGLWKRYGRIEALRGVSFQVPSGSVYSVLGPNGAGKTTLLRALSGMLRVPPGRVWVLGVDAGVDRLGVKMRVGYVAETGFLFPELTVGRNLELSAVLHRVRDVKGAVGRVASYFGIKGLLDRPYGGLSKGQRRRADLAAGLIHDPDIVVLDEPTSGLDVVSVAQLRDLIRGLKRRGKTVVVATHNISEAVELSDRILILREGRVVVEGGPGEVMESLGAVSEVIALLSRVPQELVRRLSEVSVSVRVVGLRVYARTRDPVETILALRELSSRLGYEVRSLTVREAVWEEVFSRLSTGEPGKPCSCGCKG